MGEGQKRKGGPRQGGGPSFKKSKVRILDKGPKYTCLTRSWI